MTYLTEAHNRLLAGLAKASPAELPTFPTSQDFEAQSAHIKTVSSLLTEYLFALATDGAHNSTGRAINSEVTGFVGDALSDFAAQFDAEADRLREDEPSPRSDYAEHNTHNFAMSGAK